MLILAIVFSFCLLGTLLAKTPDSTSSYEEWAKRRTKDIENAKQQKGRTTKAAEDDNDVKFHKLDLRVGTITHVWRHPNASHLFVETVNVGDTAEDRVIVSGLGNYLQGWMLVNKTVIVVCNLKPAKFRGIMSHGMLLCASSTYNNITRVELVRPPENSVNGHRVFIQNRTGVPDVLLNPKEKVWPRIQVDLKSDNDGNIVWRNEILQTVQGRLRVFHLTNSSIY